MLKTSTHVMGESLSATDMVNTAYLLELMRVLKLSRRQRALIASRAVRRLQTWADICAVAPIRGTPIDVLRAETSLNALAMGRRLAPIVRA